MKKQNEFEIVTFSEKYRSKWDCYVNNHQNGTFYHQIAWKEIIENCYGHKSHYLIAKSDNDTLLGVLPIFYTNSIFIGKNIISVPFGPYGGACYNDDSICQALYSEAMNLGSQQNINKYQFRSLNEFPSYLNFQINDSYSTFILDLCKEKEILWAGIHRKIRNMVRKGEKNGLTFQISTNSDGVDDFYEIYCDNMKKLGTPVHSINFFDTIYDKFEGDVIIGNVKLHNTTISSLFLLKYNQNLISGWGASRQKYLKFAPNDFMYWNVIDWANKNNFKTFDFGRSKKDTGNYFFKKRWGAVEMPLYYHSTDQNNDLTESKKVDFCVNMWKKLPLRMTKIIGPYLRGGIF